MVDVSVILIGYNDAGRLPTALASIQNQSLRSIEIIAVDDHSTDDSLAILESAAKLDPRIRVVRLPTNSGGCSAPRNRGLELATGEFVMFCDSDDTLDRHACRNLVTAARSMNADLVVGAAERHLLDTGEKKIWWPELHSSTRVVQQLGDCTDLLYDTISVNKIYRRKFLNEHSLTFPEGLLFEDQLFTLEAYLAAKRIGIIPEVVYRWNVVRTDATQSITQSRKDLRNLGDRIEINKRMDQLLAAYPDIAMAKNIKFLRHEASLYLTTIFQADPQSAEQLAHALAEYCRTILVEAYVHVRPGIRIALYYLLVGDSENVITSLRWEKGGGVIATELEFTPTGQVYWQPERGDVLGRSAQWWLDATALQVPLIPPGRRRYLHTWIAKDQITTVDPFGEINEHTVAELFFIEERTGGLVSVPLRFGSRSGHTITWQLNLNSLSLIQDRGINPTERGTVVVQIQDDQNGWHNRSPLTDRLGLHAGTSLDLSSIASFDCADSLVLDATAQGPVTWSASGTSKSLGSVARKLRRKIAPGVTQRPAVFDVATNRPVFLYAPAPLPTFDTRMTRFDTQAWIDEFGTDAYLLIPQEPFTPAPARFTYAYRTYSPQRLSAAYSVATYVITDQPELVDSDRAIAYRQDLGAARYLLPALNTSALQTTEELHARVRHLLDQNNSGGTP